MLSREQLIEAARKNFAQNTKEQKEMLAKFDKITLRDAKIVVLEYEQKRAFYEVVIDAETGEFITSRYRSPSTEA